MEQKQNFIHFTHTPSEHSHLVYLKEKQEEKNVTEITACGPHVRPSPSIHAVITRENGRSRSCLRELKRVPIRLRSDGSNYSHSPLTSNQQTSSGWVLPGSTTRKKKTKIFGTFSFMIVFQAEHNILRHPFPMFGVAGVFVRRRLELSRQSRSSKWDSSVQSRLISQSPLLRDLLSRARVEDGSPRPTPERHLLSVSELLSATAYLLPRPCRQTVFGDPCRGAPAVFFNSFQKRSEEDR